MILNDGTNVMGAAAVAVDPELVERVAGLNVADVKDEVKAGRLTVADAVAAEDPRNGGRGRKGVLRLAAG